MTTHIFNTAQHDNCVRDEPKNGVKPTYSMSNIQAVKAAALLFAIVVGLVIQTSDQAKKPTNTDRTDAVQTAFAITFSHNGADND